MTHIRTPCSCKDQCLTNSKQGLRPFLMSFPLHGPGTASGSSLPWTSWKWSWPWTCSAFSDAGSLQSPHIPTGNWVEVQEWDPPVSQKASITFDGTRTNSEDLLFIMLSSCHQLLSPSSCSSDCLLFSVSLFQTSYLFAVPCLYLTLTFYLTPIHLLILQPVCPLPIFLLSACLFIPVLVFFWCYRKLQQT